MFYIVEDRPTVAEAQVSCFEREGVAAAAATASEFLEWLESAGDEDVRAIEGFLLGASANKKGIAAAIRARSKSPVIAVLDGRALVEVLEFFAAGVDDVAFRPCHVREILARINAIRRRPCETGEGVELAGIRVYFDGREPEVAGTVLALPRRERRILEYLVATRSTRVTKTQIFNRVYGLFNEGIQECVIESHISRLRKRLRDRLGYDPIDSQRYLGYRLGDPRTEAFHASAAHDQTSLTQGQEGLLGLGMSLREEIDHGTLRNYDDERVGYGCSS